MSPALLVSLLFPVAVLGSSPELELRLNPLVAEVGARDASHFGSALALLVSPSEGLSVGLSGRYYWVSRADKTLHPNGWDVLMPTSTLLTWTLLAGTELSFLRGEYLALGAGPLELAAALSAGVGAVGTRHQLKPASETSGPATYGETGVRLGGSVGAGLSAKLRRRLALHLSVDILLYSNRSSKVNGCDAADLDLMDRTQRAGGELQDLAVGSGCELSRFYGTDPVSGLNRGSEVPLAKNVVNEPDSKLLNRATLSLGASWTF